VIRGALSLLIGVVLALLLAAASQLILLPFVSTLGLGGLRLIGGIVFWGVTLYVVLTVVRGRRR
jgi:hypothetical protein